MAAQPPICNFGEPAKAFDLPATDGKRYTLESARGPNGLLVIFMCNHCPYVKAVLDRMIRDAKDLQARGIGVIAINANDPEQYPADSFDNMKRLAEEKKFPFPYAFDETQEVARAYGAVCTPGLLRLQQGTSSCSTAAGWTRPRPRRCRARSASCTRRWSRSPRPAAGPRSRSRAWAARSNGRRRPEPPLAHLARVKASQRPPPIRQMPLALGQPADVPAREQRTGAAGQHRVGAIGEHRDRHRA